MKEVSFWAASQPKDHYKELTTPPPPPPPFPTPNPTARLQGIRYAWKQQQQQQKHTNTKHVKACLAGAQWSRYFF